MSRNEDGVAVVVAIGLMALLVFVALLGGGTAVLVAAHRQAQAAADLAALAGAAAAEANDAPCAAATRVAERNGTVLRSCSSDGSVVLVVVEKGLAGILATRTVEARARAGPLQ